VTAQEGDVVPVGQTIALIAEAGAAAVLATGPLTTGPLITGPLITGPLTLPSPRRGEGEGARPFPAGAPSASSTLSPEGRGQGEGGVIKASPLARRIAAEHGVDLARIKTPSGKIEKADVLAFVESLKGAPSDVVAVRRVAASPKARRLAAERGVELGALRGSGPGGAVLVADVPARPLTTGPLTTGPLTTGPLTLPSPQRGEGEQEPSPPEGERAG
jgi:pyruvate dehydrogenase E2 component (dihydrolipoamide acetyltransferase)